MLRSTMIAAAAALTLAGSFAIPAIAYDTGSGGHMEHVGNAVSGKDQLAFTLTDTGSPTTDGSYTLECHPGGGDHRAPQRACDALDTATRSGSDPFAPVSKHAQCTMIYGGPATAHVTGTWKGKEVDARFKRTNGCEVERWDRLVPALPKTS